MQSTAREECRTPGGLPQLKQQPENVERLDELTAAVQQMAWDAHRGLPSDFDKHFWHIVRADLWAIFRRCFGTVSLPVSSLDWSWRKRLLQGTREQKNWQLAFNFIYKRILKIKHCNSTFPQFVFQFFFAKFYDIFDHSSKVRAEVDHKRCYGDVYLHWPTGPGLEEDPPLRMYHSSSSS